jgi:hypothetical protein
MIAYKIDVSHGLTEQVQLHAFSLGYYWEYDHVKLNDRFKPCHLRSHYLFLNEDGTIWYSDDINYFRNSRNNYTLITAENFLKLTKK